MVCFCCKKIDVFVVYAFRGNLSETIQQKRRTGATVKPNSLMWLYILCAVYARSLSTILYEMPRRGNFF